MKKVMVWIMICISVLGIFLLNYFSMPLHDELGYAFWEQAMPDVDPVPRVSSLVDIVKEQYLCYFAPGGNGRVFVHAIVAAFAVGRAYLLFDFCNTVVWCLLVWLVLRSAGVAKVSAGKYLAVFLSLFYLAWFAEACCQNSAYAVNYLWPTTMAVAVLWTWTRWRSWWLVPLSLFVGWSQESVSVPLLFALGLGSVGRCIRERRLVLNKVQVFSLLMMVIGVGMLCCGPAARGRAGEHVLTLEGIFKSNLPHAIADGVFCFTPMLVCLALLYVLWVNRRTVADSVIPHLELWMFVICVAGLYFVVVNAGAQRVMFSGLVVACVLLLAHRNCFAAAMRHRRVVVAMCLVWLIVSVAVQLRLGTDAKEMVDTYCADSQNVTYWRARTNLLYSAGQTFLYPIHWRFLQLECGKEKEAICFSPWFYENFYRNPESFFSQAKAIPGAETVCISSRCPVLAVKRGEDDLTEEQRSWVRKAGVPMDTSLWRKFLPGRFEVKLPPDWQYARLPRNQPVTLTICGKRYTVYAAAGQ